MCEIRSHGGQRKRGPSSNASLNAAASNDWSVLSKPPFGTRSLKNMEKKRLTRVSRIVYCRGGMRSSQNGWANNYGSTFVFPGDPEEPILTNPLVISFPACYHQNLAGSSEDGNGATDDAWG